MLEPQSHHTEIPENTETALYQKLPAECYESLQAVEPLREMPADRPKQEKLYEVWAK